MSLETLIPCQHTHRQMYFLTVCRIILVIFILRVELVTSPRCFCILYEPLKRYCIAIFHVNFRWVK